MPELMRFGCSMELGLELVKQPLGLELVKQPLRLELVKQQERIIKVVGLSALWGAVITVCGSKFQTEVFASIKQDFPRHIADQSIVAKVLPGRKVIEFTLQLLPRSELFFSFHSKDRFWGPGIDGGSDFP